VLCILSGLHQPPWHQGWIEEKKALESECSEYGVRMYRNYLEDFAPSFPLLSYACDHWHKHQNRSELWSEPLPEYESLHLHILENEQIRVAWLRLEDGGGARFMPRFDWNNTRVVWHDGTQALYWAALLGLRGTVTLLCDPEHNLDVNHVAGKYGYPLQAAAYAGDSGIVNFLIERGADLKFEGGYYGTALRASVSAGHRDVVSKLLLADPECARSANGGYGSALQTAVEGGDEQIVESLLKAGADPNCPIQDRFEEEEVNTLLLETMKRRNLNMTKMMIESGANIDFSSSRLLSGSIECESEELIQTLLQATNITDPILDEWLILAVRRAHKGIIRLLIDAGANPNGFHKVHSSAAAAMLQDAEKGKAAVELLIELGLEIEGDHHLLIAAILAGLDSMAKDLLSLGADIYEYIKGTGNALMVAAGLGNEAFVKILLNAGAKPNIEDSDEGSERMHSALIRAMIYGLTSPNYGVQRSVAIVQQLINAGVDVNEGGDALCEAITCHYEIRLRDEPAEHCKNFVEPMVKLLLANRADLHGPLGAIPSIICASAHEVTLDLVDYLTTRVGGFERRRQLLHRMHYESQENFDVHRMFVISCSMLAHKDTIVFLEEEMKIEALDLTRACEVLSAACWSFGRPGYWSRGHGAEECLPTILQTMVDIMGPGNGLFDELLQGAALERSMGPYINQTTPRKKLVTKEDCVTKVRAYLTEILGNSRLASSGGAD